MTDCLFCKMIQGEISIATVFEDDDILAFNDINPQSPTHILIIPKQHIPTINALNAKNIHLVGKLFITAKHIAYQHDFAEAGYRTIMNCNTDGGQKVYHIHLHLLAGRQHQWPPG